MFSDPLLLAIISMLVGMVFGVVCSIIALLVWYDLHKDDPKYPTDEEMDQLCLWYDAEYTQKGAHEK